MATLMRWDPFADLMTIQRDINRLFSEVASSNQEGTGGNRNRQAFMPNVDVMSREGDMIIRAELPGMRPEDIDVAFTDGVLTIKGEHQQDVEEKQADYILHETVRGSFQRSMRLPEGVHADQIQADYHDGILEVTVPKAARLQQPATTHVQIGQGRQQIEGQARVQSQPGQQAHQQELRERAKQMPIGHPGPSGQQGIHTTEAPTGAHDTEGQTQPADQYVEEGMTTDRGGPGTPTGPDRGPTQYQQGPGAQEAAQTFEQQGQQGETQPAEQQERQFQTTQR